MTITADTIVLSIATVVGPATAVAVGAWLQGRFVRHQQRFERKLAHEIENLRSQSESSRDFTENLRHQIFGNPEAKNISSISESLGRVATALESSMKSDGATRNGSETEVSNE